jgi:hypothetical protein
MQSEKGFTSFTFLQHFALPAQLAFALIYFQYPLIRRKKIKSTSKEEFPTMRQEGSRALYQ